MNRIKTVTRTSLDDLLEKLSLKLGIRTSMLVPFTDHTDLMTSLLGHIAGDQEKLLVAGHASPDIAIAADRAGLKTVEVLGASPFVNHAEDILEALDSENNIVYLANPNWVTGSDYAFDQLSQIAEALADGWLIIDEKYHDFYGISGLPLLEHSEQMVITRSVSAGFSIGSDNSGCLAGSPRFIERFKDTFDWSRISSTMFRLFDTVLVNGQAAAKRLAEVHNESLRLVNELTKIGVQNRITATDFLLLRVADPKRVGNSLAGFGTPVENLEGYPELANYVRYRIQSPLSNENLLAAFRRMPSDYYKMDTVDKRTVMFHRPQESVGNEAGKSTPRRSTGRTKTAGSRKTTPVG